MSFFAIPTGVFSIPSNAGELCGGRIFLGPDITQFRVNAIHPFFTFALPVRVAREASL